VVCPQCCSGLKGDLLGSGDGDDIVMGSQGNDTLLGGGGRDLIIAGAGDDNIIGDGHVTIYEGNNSWDVVREIVPMTPENGQTGDLYKMNWQEAWSTYPEAVKTSPDSSDIIYAGNGDDWVLAQNGDDFVDAGPGNDKIWSNGGNDTIAGDAFARYRDRNKDNIYTNHGVASVYN
jgi:Ca2+-binding RTX toxin-like protein